jgi:hypothetical protein
MIGLALPMLSICLKFGPCSSNSNFQSSVGTEAVATSSASSISTQIHEPQSRDPALDQLSSLPCDQVGSNPQSTHQQVYGHSEAQGNNYALSSPRVYSNLAIV